MARLNECLTVADMEKSLINGRTDECEERKHKSEEKERAVL